MGTLAASNYWRKELNLGALRQSHDSIYHLVYSLLANWLAAVRTVWHTTSSIEKSHVIINLRHCANSRTWVVVGTLLVDGDSWWHTFHVFYVWLFHLAQELTGIGRKGLHITTLSLCKYCIEG